MRILDLHHIVQTVVYVVMNIVIMVMKQNVFVHSVTLDHFVPHTHVMVLILMIQLFVLEMGIVMIKIIVVNVLVGGLVIIVKFHHQ
jgi:hypothetical protein